MGRLGERSKTAEMRDAAGRVLGSYQSTGEPFSLFLSSWSFDAMRKRALSLLDHSNREVQVRIGLERQVRILLKMDRLETVSVYRKGDHKRIARPHDWPALTFSDDEWLARVSAIAAQADLITLFWGTTTPGLAEELKICASGTNALKTVLVMPATPLAIWQSQVQKRFPRIVPLAEIPPFFPLHPEFTPLIERMKAILRIDPKARSALVDSEERLRRFPLPSPAGRFDRDFWIEQSG